MDRRRTFIWDPRKAKSNLLKHGVSFVEATTVFFDPFPAIFSDRDHSESEERWLLIGYSSGGLLLAVIFTERGRFIRVISARKATKREIQKHESEENKS